MASTYQKVTLVLAAGESRSFAAYGKKFRILSNTALISPMIRIGDETEQEVPAGIGITLSNESYNQLMIRNPDAVNPMTLEFAVASGDVDDSRLTLTGTVHVDDGGGSLTVDNANIDSIKSQLVGPGTGTDAADVVTGAAAKVVDKANTVTAFRVFADIANTDVVYLGFSNTVSATRKIIGLKPGMMWGEDNLKADIWAFSTVAQKVSITQW